MRRNTFRQAYLHCSLTQPEKLLLCNMNSLLRTFASNKTLSVDTLPSNRCSYSGIDMIFNCEVMETEKFDR